MTNWSVSSAFPDRLGQGPNNWYQSGHDPDLGVRNWQILDIYGGSGASRGFPQEPQPCQRIDSSLRMTYHGSWPETPPEPPPQSIGPVLGAYGDRCSTGHGSWRGSPHEQSLQSNEGKILHPPKDSLDRMIEKLDHMNDIIDRFLEERARSRRESEFPLASLNSNHIQQIRADSIGTSTPNSQFDQSLSMHQDARSFQAPIYTTNPSLYSSPMPGSNWPQYGFNSMGVVSPTSSLGQTTSTPFQNPQPQYPNPVQNLGHNCHLHSSYQGLTQEPAQIVMSISPNSTSFGNVTVQPSPMYPGMNYQEMTSPLYQEMNSQGLQNLEQTHFSPVFNHQQASYASGWDQISHISVSYNTPATGYDYYNQQQPQQAQQQSLVSSFAPADNNSNSNYCQLPVYSSQGSLSDFSYSQSGGGQQPTYGQDTYCDSHHVQAPSTASVNHNTEKSQGNATTSLVANPTQFGSPLGSQHGSTPRVQAMDDSFMIEVGKAEESKVDCELTYAQDEELRNGRRPTFEDETNVVMSDNNDNVKEEKVESQVDFIVDVLGLHEFDSVRNIQLLLYDVVLLGSRKMQMNVITALGNNLFKKFYGESFCNLNSIVSSLRKDFIDESININVDFDRRKTQLLATPKEMEKITRTLTNILGCEKNGLKDECIKKCLFHGKQGTSPSLALFGSGTEIKHLELAKRYLMVGISHQDAYKLNEKELLRMIEQHSSGIAGFSKHSVFGPEGPEPTKVVPVMVWDPGSTIHRKGCNCHMDFGEEPQMAWDPVYSLEIQAACRIWNPGSNLQVEYKIGLKMARDYVCTVDELSLELGKGYYIDEAGHVQGITTRVVEEKMITEKEYGQQSFYNGAYLLGKIVWDPGIFFFL